MGDQAELMRLLFVRAKINSYNNTEHLPGCRIAGVERRSADFKFDAKIDCLEGFERERVDPVLSLEMNGYQITFTR